MNYTIISSKSAGWDDDLDERIFLLPKIQCFVEADKAEFLQTWAETTHRMGGEDFTILLDGLDTLQMPSDMYDQYEQLETEMGHHLKQVRERAEAERARIKEENAQKALAEARRRAKLQRAADEAELLRLQQKLGIK